MRPRIFAVLAVSAFALVGCSASEGSPEPQPTVTATSAPSASPDETAQASVEASTEKIEEEFIVEYKQMAGNVDLYSEDELVEIGYDTCELMKDGKKVPHNFTGDTQGDHSVGIPAGMAAKAKLCPEVTD